MNFQENDVASKSKIWMKKNTEITSKILTAFEKSNKTFCTEAGYINFLYDDCKSLIAPVAKLIDKQINTQCSKNTCISNAHRSQGNDAYKAKKFKRSLEYYTKSIRHAPIHSKELALAYANRSAVSFETFKFHDCILDINKCLNYPYPDNLKYKVYSRLAYCYKHLGNVSEGLKTLSHLKKSLDYVTDSAQVKKVTDSIVELEEAFNDLATGKKVAEYAQPSNKTEYDIPIPSYGKNPNFLSASAAIELRKGEEVGRYVVATRNIKRGDTLFVEMPYCSLSSIKDTDALCSNCDKHCLLLTPCRNCDEMMYCSDDCQETAWNTYHRWECNGLIYALGENIGLANLALRILLKGSQVNFDISNQKLDECYGCEDNNYACVYHLVTNIDKMNVEDVVTYAVCAITTVYYLKVKTDFFDWFATKSNMAKTEMSRFLSCRILRHLCQLQCNAHAEEFQFGMFQYHKSALYPSAAMMNHSCNSNILNDFYDSWLIVRAARNIKNGEEVCNSYGLDYRSARTVDRQKILYEQYYFYCQCEACTDEKFKLYFELHHALKCPECGGKTIMTEPDNTDYTCIECHHQLAQDSITLKKYKRVLNAEKNNLNEVQMLHLLKDCAYEDNMKITEVSNDLYMQFQLDNSFDEGLCVAKKYLEAIIKEYGIKSHFVARKMLDISLLMLKNMQYHDMLNNTRFRAFAIETLQFLKETKERLSVFYGPWNHKIKLINEYIATAEAVWKGYLRFTDQSSYF